MSREEKKIIAMAHLNKMMSDSQYLIFVENYTQFASSSTSLENFYFNGVGTVMWWENEGWLDNPNVFNLSAVVNQQTGQYDRLTAAERNLVKLYPIEAYLISRNSPKAIQETIRIFGTNGLNDKSDAFRHAFFNAMNERDCGNTMFFISIAKLFSDAHESDTPTNLILEKQMDIFNNTVGQDLVGLLQLIASDSSLSDQVYSKLINGELRYLSPLDFTNYFHGIIPNVTHLTPTN